MARAADQKVGFSGAFSPKSYTEALFPVRTSRSGRPVDRREKFGRRRLCNLIDENIEEGTSLWCKCSVMFDDKRSENAMSKTSSISMFCRFRPFNAFDGFWLEMRVKSRRKTGIANRDVNDPVLLR